MQSLLYKSQQEIPFSLIFEKLQDPRRTEKGNLRHRLTDIIFLVISAVISGANDWKAIEIFGKSQITWLKKYGSYKYGIPSEDTLGRVFSKLDSSEFSKCFSEWTSEISTLTEGEVVAIDGKRMRGSYDTTSGKSAIHMVSAYASDNGLCLGQVNCEDKSNEITAIPELLELIAVKGCTVTIDAMGCQKKIAEKIIEKEADYILAVKENQKELLDQIKTLFNVTRIRESDLSVDSGHGRVEQRKCSIIDDLRFLDVASDWKNIKSVVRIESERYIKVSKKTQKETRYYISSSVLEAKKINTKIREHWSVENKLHWLLDVEFKEDTSRRRMGNSAKNFNLISKIALALVSNFTTAKKISIKGKRFKAALDTGFREKIIKV